mgnify:CR=1 FL=1
MANRLMQGTWQWIQPTHEMRDEVLALLSDADLAFSPGGSNMKLGELIREWGEIEHAYTEGFKTFKQDFDYRHPDPTIATSSDRLKTWLKALDADMAATVEAYTDAEVDSKPIMRPGDYPAAIDMQVNIYLQALLIFLSKLSVFLRAANKPLPPALVDWIG